jgi:hypothetical protein
MKLFIQVAFDLEDCKKPEYTKVNGWLESIGLKREIDGSRLPANTYVGIRDFKSRDEALAYMQRELNGAALLAFCEGKAFIAVSEADRITHVTHPMKPSM